MFFSDQSIIESTKVLAARADKVLQLADENGKSPEAAAALLAMGEEIASALTQLSRAVQARVILKSTLETLHARAETMQRTQHISEVSMLTAFTWAPAKPQAWGGLATFNSEDDDIAFGDENNGAA